MIKIFCVAMLGMFIGAQVAGAQEKTLLLEGFENAPQFELWPPDSAKAEVTDQWSSEGKHSLLVHAGTMVTFNLPKAMDWNGYQVLRFHARVPGKEGVRLGLEIADSGPGYLNRHHDATSAPPGDSVVEIDISGDLWRGEVNHPYRLLKTPLDKKAIARYAIDAQSGDLYIDQIELATVPAIATPGGFAFQFGRTGATIQSQWTGINPGSKWDEAKGFGITGGHAFGQNTPYPTPVMGGGITLDDAQFVATLKTGPYVGWLVLERSGFWEGEAASYRKATLLVNGDAAVNQQWDPAGSLFDFQDLEVLSQDDLVKMVLARNSTSDFHFDAVDGRNSFQLTSEGGSTPPRLAGLVIAPDTAEGRAFIEAHKKLQRETIAKVNRVLNNPPAATARLAEALVTAPLASDVVMRPEDLPADLKSADIPPADAFAGTTANIAIGVYAGAEMTLSPIASDLKAGDETIPATAIHVLRNVYMPVRGYEQSACTIESHHYRADVSFSVGPNLARTVLVQIDVPTSAKPGTYRGTLTLSAQKSLPLAVEVHAGILPTADFPVGLFHSGMPATQDQIGAEEYWKLTEQMLQLMQRAGLTMVTGGPNARPVWNGATVHYEGDDFLHYLQLARKYGMDQAVVNYGGLNISGPRGEMRAEAGLSEAQTYAALYKAWQDFSTANGLPPYYLYCYDEPATAADFAPIEHLLTTYKTAGFKTIGFTSIENAQNIDADHAMLVKDSTAVAMANHTKESVAKVKEMGTEPWLYSLVSRTTFGIDTFRAHRYGVQGRFGWIGAIVQGFQYDTLDSREPDPSCFYIHREQGVLIAPRFVGVMEAGMDLRMLLELERLAKARGAGAEKIDAFLAKLEEHPYRSGYTNEELGGIRKEGLELLKDSMK